MRSLVRKLEQVARNPVLRRYLLRRALGTVSAPPVMPTGSRPPYLDIPASFSGPSAPWLSQTPAAGRPTGPLCLDLPGEQVTLNQPDRAFDRVFADIETEAALHRFAWLPLSPGTAAAWIAGLWGEWRARHGDGGDGPAWEAYTAAERVCNLLDHVRRHGAPWPLDDFVAVMAGHVPRILAGLEYHGEAATHNHLANNGRGLYRLGVELNIPEAAQTGLAILEAEAERLLLPSGLLREGSSHYQFLYLRNYADVWLCARRHARPETGRLEAITRRLAAAARVLVLPGGVPLVGDISPDSPPEYLAGLMPGNPRQGWLAGLEPAEAEAMETLLAGTAPADPAHVAADGFLRLDRAGWSCLMRAEPDGWTFYPGHGHQDMGSFELHYGPVRVIVDAGRGRYGESGESAFYRSAAAHNGLTLGTLDPYPVNKPYFDDRFRRDVAGSPPQVEWSPDHAAIAFAGYARFGVTTMSRALRLEPNRVIIDDHAQGRGHHTLTRRFHTPLEVEVGAEEVILGRRFRLSAPGGTATIEPRTLWSAYGRGQPGHVVTIHADAALPWQGRIVIEVI